MSEPQYVGVIGGGTMGAGIAQVAASAGFPVFLVDTALERAEAGRVRIRANLRRLVDKGQLAPEEGDVILNRITASEFLQDLQICSFVIEAVFENFDSKSEILNDLGAVLPDDAVVATNTSSISITRLADCYARPEQIIGMHFFNPVPVMTLIELIRADQTSDDTVETARAMASRFGKTPIEVRDSPGFVANRLLIPMINEAISLLEEKVATREAIDETMKLGAGHPMGPLRLADLIGLDVVLSIAEVLEIDLADDKYQPAELLRELVAAGKLGRKSGEGIYEYR